MNCPVICVFREQKQSSKVPEFQKILLQVQNALSLTEVQELVFLCTEMLSKDLSSVDTASRLFVLLQDHDLLSAEDSSLLLELLKIIKRDKLIRDLQLNPRQLSSRVSLYRSVQHFGGTFWYVLAALHFSLVSL